MSTSNPAASLWSCELKKHQLTHATKAGNYLAAIDDANNLVLIDALTGKPFPTPISNQYTAVQLSDVNNVIYMAYTNGFLIIMDSTNGQNGPFSVFVFELCQIIKTGQATKVWSKESIIPANGAPSSSVSEGVLYTTYTISSSVPGGSSKNYLMALSVETGDSAWIHNSSTSTKKKSKHHGGAHRPPEVEELSETSGKGEDKTVLTHDNTTLLITLADGSSGAINTSEHFCANQETIYTPINSQLFAFNKAFGDRKFPRSTMVNAPTSPKVSMLYPIFSTEKGIIVTGKKNSASKSCIYAIDPIYGGQVWSYPATVDGTPPVPDHRWRVACVSEDTTQVLIYSEEGLVQLLDTKTGEAVWSSPVQLGIPAGATIVSVKALIDIDNVQVIPQILPSGGSGSVSSKNLFRINLNISPLVAEKLPFIGENDSAPTTPPLTINGSVLLTSTTGTGSTMDTTVSATPLLEDENAAYFAGGENSISFTDIGNILNFKTGGFTLECWMRSTIGGQIFESKASSGTNAIRLNVSSEGVMALAITASSGNDYIAYVTDKLGVTDGEWHHIAIAVESGKGHFYIDGMHFPSNKVQRYDGKQYYNDDYTVTKSTYGANKGPSHHLKQITSDASKPLGISIKNQTSFSIGASSTSTSNASVGFTGLLREFRIWNNALDADKINSRMFKILGPFQKDDPTKNQATHKYETNNPIKGQEPKMVVNVHMDKSHSVNPNQFSNAGTANTTPDVLNDVNPDSPQFGTFNFPCSTPTDIDLELKGFPYILDHDIKKWPFEEHWAVRGEHATSTDVALSSDGVICFGANNYIYGVRKHDGKGLWTIPMGMFSNPIDTDMGFLVLASEETSGGKLCLIHPQDGTLQVVSKATSALGTFSTSFQSNRLLAAYGTYIIYAQTGGGVGILSDLESLTSIAPTASYTAVENLQIVGSNGYWCETDGTNINLRGYNLETGAKLFDSIPVASAVYTVNAQHLYYVDSSNLAAVKATNGDAVTSVALSTVNTGLTTTNFSGMIIAPSGNQLIVTQNGNTTGSITAVRPATLSQIWTKAALNKEVNAPIVGTDGRNVYCTAKHGGSGSTKGSIIVRDLNSGDDRGSFTVNNPVESPALVDRGMVYFACSDNTSSSGDIDGAVHQVVIGDTNVLELDGSSYFEITNPTTSTEETACWGYLNPTNACVETWVNLKNPPINEQPTPAGIVSLSTGNAGQGVNLEMHVADDQSVHFSGFYFDGASTTSIKFKSATGAIKLGQWCHIAVNMSNDASKPKYQLFVDGKPKAVTSEIVDTTPTCPTSFKAYLGATGSLSGPVSNETTGLIGMVRIWNTYQTVSQIMDRMHIQLIGTEENLMADWSFNKLSAEDVAGNATTVNGFTIAPQGSSKYILNELNLEKPNYPYLTYKGEKYAAQISHKDKTYDEYKLTISAHKADGSPLANQNIDIWYAEGGASSVYLMSGVTSIPFSTKDSSSNPWKNISLESGVSNQTIPTNAAPLTPPNGITAQTDSEGQVILRVATTDLSNGPGFDLYSDIIPRHERFHVNTLINRQELKVVPPPTIHAQGELIQDYHYSTGGVINSSRQKSVYRSILKIEKPDKSPCVNEMVMVYTDTPQQISVEGQVYSVTSKNGAALYTNALGEIMIEADAKDTKGFMLEVWASFMHKNERTKYSVSESSHKRLAGVKSDDLTSKYTTSWTGSGQKTSSSLLPSQYHGSSKQVAHSFRHLMAVSNPNKNGTADPNKVTDSKHLSNGNGLAMTESSNGASLKDNQNTGLLTSSEPYTKPASKPSMRQPIGSPAPDLLSSIRTLSHINRKKTMDMQAFKESVLAAATKLKPSNKPAHAVQGIKIGFVKGSSSHSGGHGGPPLTVSDSNSQVTLEYLDADGLSNAKLGQPVNQSDWLQGAKEDIFHLADKIKADVEDLEGGMAEWFGSDLFHDVESLAEKAADAFENLVKDAEAMVLDFTSEIETAITSVLNDLGPIGHLLADGVEKVMAVVDKVIHFVDVLIDIMLDFLMILFEWEHILNTQVILLNSVFTPALSNTKSLLKDGAFITDLADGFVKVVDPSPPKNPQKLQTSVGSQRAQHSTPSYVASAHGVKSKSMVHKTQTHASNSRNSGISSYTKTPKKKSEDYSKGTKSFLKSSNSTSSALGTFNPAGSLSTLSSIIEAPYELINNGSSFSDLLTDLTDTIENLLGYDEFKALDTFLTQPIEIPFVSALYDFITGDQLTPLNLISLLSAIPVFVVYEAYMALVKNVTTAPDKYFDHNLSLQTSIPLPSDSSASTTMTDTTGNGLSDITLQPEAVIEANAIICAVFSTFSTLMDTIVVYRTYQDLKVSYNDDFNPKVDPLIGLFKGLSGLLSIGTITLKILINAEVKNAMKVNKTFYVSSPKPSGLSKIESLIPGYQYYTYFKLISSYVGAIKKMYSFTKWIEPGQVKEAYAEKSKYDHILATLIMIYGIAKLIGDIVLDVEKAEAIKTSGTIKSTTHKVKGTQFGMTLENRVDEHILASIFSSLADIFSGVADSFCDRTSRYEYLGISIGTTTFDILDIILTTSAELNYGINENETTKNNIPNETATSTSFN